MGQRMQMGEALVFRIGLWQRRNEIVVVGVRR